MAEIHPSLREQYLRAQGLDPAEFDFDSETGQVFRKPVEQAAPPALPSPSMGAGEAFLRTGAESIVPTAGGIGGAALAMKGFGALSAAPHPVAKVIGTLGAALAGGIGAGVAQDKVLEAAIGSERRQAQREKLAQAREEHPIASLAGEFAPSMGAFTPIAGARQLPTLGRAIGNLRKPAVPMSSAQKTVLLNAGVGGAVEGAVETGQQLVTEGEISSPGRIAAAVGLGTFLSEPGRLGRKLGFEPALPSGDVNKKPKPPSSELEAEAGAAKSTTDTPSSKTGDSTATRPRFTVDEGGVVRDFADDPEIVKAVQEYSEARRGEAVRLRKVRDKINDDAALVDAVKKAAADLPTDAQVAKATLMDEAVRKGEPTEIPSKLQEELDVRERETLQDPLKQYEKEFFEKPPAGAKVSDQSRAQPSSAFVEAANEVLPATGRTGRLFDSVNDDLMKDVEALAETRGAKELVKKGIEGNLGEVDLKTRIIQLDPRAGIDTGYHEVAHLYLNDLINIGTQKQREILAEAYRVSLDSVNTEAVRAEGITPETIAKLEANPDLLAEEALVQAVGIDAAQTRARQLFPKKDWKLLTKAISENIKEWKSALAYYTGFANREDLVRIMRQAVLEDRPLAEALREADLMAAPKATTEAKTREQPRSAFEEAQAKQHFKNMREAADTAKATQIVKGGPVEASPTKMQRALKGELARIDRAARQQGASPLADENFKLWFDKSTVVDSQGNPLVVYHGGLAGLETFDPSKAASRADSGRYGQDVTYFSTADEAANYGGRYGRDRQDYAVYLRIENPYVVRSAADLAGINKRKLIAQGYDGIYEPNAEYGGTSRPIWAPFSPTQIKSVDNVGTYGVDDPRIRHQGESPFQVTEFEPRRQTELTETVGAYTFDRRKGAGQTPNQANINYRGFSVKMSPDKFLQLNPQRYKDSTGFFTADKPLAPPFLEVDWDAARGVWQITGHEGRNRATFLRDNQPEFDIPVDIIPRNLRNKSVTDEMLRAPIVADKNAVRGIRYQDISPLSDAFDTQFAKAFAKQDIFGVKPGSKGYLTSTLKAKIFGKKAPVLPTGEVEFLRMAGLEDALNKGSFISAEELAEFTSPDLLDINIKKFEKVEGLEPSYTAMFNDEIKAIGQKYGVSVSPAQTRGELYLDLQTDATIHAGMIYPSSSTGKFMIAEAFEDLEILDAIRDNLDNEGFVYRDPYYQRSILNSFKHDIDTERSFLQITRQTPDSLVIENTAIEDFNSVSGFAEITLNKDGFSDDSPNWRDLHWRASDFLESREPYLKKLFPLDEAVFKSTEEGPSASWELNPRSFDVLIEPVDIVITLGRKGVRGDEQLRAGRGRQETHFGDTVKDDALVFVRGSMETLPTGEKVFHAFEIQSDWISAVGLRRKNLSADLADLEAAKARGLRNIDHEIVAVKAELKELDNQDPLLNFGYEMGVKIAARHALENGADFLGISNSGTVLMTEGHSGLAEVILKQDVTPELAQHLEEASFGEYPAKNLTGLKAGDRLPINVEESTAQHLLGNAPELVGLEIKQRPGMVTWYDKKLPSMASKLTGDTPFQASFGKHVSADGGFSINEKGERQTEIIANIFDLRKLKARLLDEPRFTISNKRFQPESPLGAQAEEVVLDNVAAQSKRQEVDLFPAEKGRVARFRERMFSRGFYKFSSVLDQIATDKGFGGEYIAEKFLRLFNDRDKLFGRFGNGSIDVLSKYHLKEKDAEAIMQFGQEMAIRGASDIKLGQRQFKAYLELRQIFKDARKYQNAEGPFVRELLKGREPTELWSKKQISDPIETGEFWWYNADGSTFAYYPGKGDSIFRQGGFEENFWPTAMPKIAVIETLLEHRASPAGLQLRQEFIDYRMRQRKKSGGQMTDLELKEAAIKEFEDFFKQFKNQGSARFSGIRMETGVDLPPSWRETNLERMITRYYRRYAMDMAYFKHVEEDAAARSILAVPDQFGNYAKNAKNFENGLQIEPLNNSESVKFVTDTIQRNFSKDDIKIDAANRLVKSLMLQSLTGAKDVVSAPFLLFPQMPLKSLPTMLKVIFNPKAIKRGMSKALEAGVASKHTVSQQELIPGIDTTTVRSAMAERFTTWSDMIYKYSGREVLERIARGLTMEAAYQAAIESANVALKVTKGDEFDFFQRFGPRGDSVGTEPFWRVALQEAVDAANKGNDSLLHELAMDTASNLVRDTQGTYDVRGLPALAMRGKLSPFFSLSKWNIERANNFSKNVIDPMFEGNYRPFLKATIGAVMGGAAVEYIAEQISGRKPSTPEWKTLKHAPDADMSDYLYRMSALAAISGQGGLMAELFKTGLDFKNRNDAQGFEFQIYEAGVDFAAKVRHATEALDAGEEITSVLPRLVLELTRSHIQNYRILEAHVDIFDSQKRLESSEERKQLRVFENLTDEPSPPFMRITSNPFLRSDIKKFKRTDDIQEAADILHSDILPRIKREAVGQPPERTRKRLRGLAASDRVSLPNPAQEPQKFAEYVEFVRNTRGEAAAVGLVQKAQRTRALNRAKNRMIPGIGSQ